VDPMRVMDARSSRDGYQRAQTLLDRIRDEFQRVAWIGLEHEFYFTDGQVCAWHQLLRRYRRQTGGLIKAVPERGRGQHELVFPPAPDIESIAQLHSWSMSALRSEADLAGVPVSFRSRPFRDRLGSSLQVSISLRDEVGTPTFYRALGDRRENTESLRVVNGMLTTALSQMTAFAPTPNCYQRYQRLIAEDELFSPATLSWSYSTRSAAIRIPRGGTPGEARIEHRLPGAAAHPGDAISAVLYGVYVGLERGVLPAIPKLLGKEVQSTDVPLPKTFRAAERVSRSGC
jgi:glutamine synthetase